jgi:hypothetical protein
VSTLRTKDTGLGLLLTPTVTEIGITKDRIQKRTEYQKSIGRNYAPGNLLEQIQTMLPTPTTRDANGIENSPSQKGKSRLAADLGDGTTSQLNPHFVEEMMGFPKGWTELPFLNGETKVLKDTETQ